MINQDILDVIKEYFKKYNLKVLDDGHKIRYTGVTIPYIIEYVFKNYNFNSIDIIDHLLYAVENKIISSLYCGSVGDIVFEYILTGHWRYVDRIDLKWPRSNTYKYEFYSYFLERIKYYKEIYKNEEQIITS